MRRFILLSMALLLVPGVGAAGAADRTAAMPQGARDLFASDDWSACAVECYVALDGDAQTCGLAILHTEGLNSLCLVRYAKGEGWYVEAEDDQLLGSGELDWSVVGAAGEDGGFVISWKDHDCLFKPGDDNFWHVARFRAQEDGAWLTLEIAGDAATLSDESGKSAPCGGALNTVFGEFDAGDADRLIADNRSKL